MDLSPIKFTLCSGRRCLSSRLSIRRSALSMSSSMTDCMMESCLLCVLFSKETCLSCEVQAVIPMMVTTPVTMMTFFSFLRFMIFGKKGRKPKLTLLYCRFELFQSLDLQSCFVFWVDLEDLPSKCFGTVYILVDVCVEHQVVVGGLQHGILTFGAVGA